MNRTLCNPLSSSGTDLLQFHYTKLMLNGDNSRKLAGKGSFGISWSVEV
jgi:hypothetical protein